MSDIWQFTIQAMSHPHKHIEAQTNGRHFADDTFKRIFLNENARISIKISLKFVPKGPINNNPALVQVMAWRRSGDKPLSEPMMVSLLTQICVTRPQWVNTPLVPCLSTMIPIDFGDTTLTRQISLIYASQNYLFQNYTYWSRWRQHPPTADKETNSCSVFRDRSLVNTLRPRQNGRHFWTTFSNAFYWMKMFELRLKFHWSTYLRVQLTIPQQWFRQWLGAGKATSHCLNHHWLVSWHIYASLGLNELTHRDCDAYVRQ